MPDVMAQSGAILKEVGATNKTRLSDYSAVIGERTAALLLVHPSNYVIEGFTEQASLEELVRLGREKQLCVIHDIGSGALFDFAEFGLKDEPIAAESIKAGADLALFSGDKLLGGPQCGVIVGRKNLIERIAKHPLARALRVDKLTLAGLSATLRLYRDKTIAKRSIPLLALLSTPIENLRDRAERLAPQLAALEAIESATAQADTTFLGGGSVPTQRIGTWVIAIRGRKLNVERLAARLRAGSPAVVGRARDDRLLLDLRSVFPRQDQELVTALAALGPSA